MFIKIWLDDVRPMPYGYTHHCKTACEAIELIKQGKVREVSLDHDLGDYATCGDGYQVACFIERGAAEGWLGRIQCYVHSANPVGRMKMEAAIACAERAWSYCEIDAANKMTITIMYSDRKMIDLNRKKTNGVGVKR